jgi:hypothetical protein
MRVRPVWQVARVDDPIEVFAQDVKKGIRNTEYGIRNTEFSHRFGFYASFPTMQQKN